MTCIVGVRFRKGVILGADSASSDGHRIYPSRTPKIARRGDLLIAYTSSWRWGDILSHALPPQKAPWRGLDRWLRIELVDAIRTASKSSGYMVVNNNSETAGAALLAVRGRLYTLGSDLHVGESLRPYITDGSGCDFAAGSLYGADIEGDPEGSVRTALRAAAENCTTVCGPFTLWYSWRKAQR